MKKLSSFNKVTLIITNVPQVKTSACIYFAFISDGFYKILLFTYTFSPSKLFHAWKKQIIVDFFLISKK